MIRFDCLLDFSYNYNGKHPLRRMGRQRVSVNYRRVIHQVYSEERQLADCEFGVEIQEDDLLKTIGISRVDFDTFQWICKSWGMKY